MFRSLLRLGCAAATATVSLATFVPPVSVSAAEPDDHPRLVTYLQPAKRRVIQALTFTAGNWWTTQAIPHDDGSEDVVVSRMTRRGVLLDSMQLTGAGHGISFAVQVDGTRRWVWTTWREPTGGCIVARVPYQAGATLGRADVEPIQTWGPYSAVSVAGDWLVFKVNGGLYERRRLADVLAGVDATYGEVLVNTGDPIYQGHTTSGDTLYRLTGRPGGRVSLQRWSWSTGQLLEERDLSSALPYAPNREPEGMAAYVDGAGRSMVMLGLVVGYGADRYRVYGLGDPRNDLCVQQRTRYVTRRPGRPRMVTLVDRQDCAHWTARVRLVWHGAPLRDRRVSLSVGDQLLVARTGRLGYARFRLLTDPAVRGVVRTRGARDVVRFELRPVTR